jgi:phosphonate dehydrogenase
MRDSEPRVVIRPRVVITQRVHAEVVRLLAEHAEVIVNEDLDPWSAETLLAHARQATALMVFMPDSLNAAFLEQCPELKIVAAALKGCDNFDVEACASRGIWFTIVPDLLSEPTAELALTLLLGLARHVRAGDAHIRSGDYRGWRPWLYGRSVSGSTAGLIGYGAVGRAFARLISGFDCRVIWHDSRQGGERLEKVAAHSDFLLPFLPLTRETFHLINRDFLASMKPGAYLINVGRGSVVDEEAVADSLESGHLAGYAADVFEMEDWRRADRPCRISPRLLRLGDRTLFTPHLGSATHTARMEIERTAALSIIDVLTGNRPRNAVDACGVPLQS